MNFTFENQRTNTYLVYKVLDDDTIDTMSLGMLTNNKIPGLAPTIFMQMDDSKYIKYNVSARISVKEFFLGPVNKKRLLGVFNGIIEALMSAEDYMIDVNSIIMDLEHIFTDVSTCETFLICLPLSNMENSVVDLSTFFKKIMFSTQFDQTENCDHVAKIMNYLNSTPIFTLNDFKTLLDSIKNDIVAQYPVQQKVQLTAQPIAVPIAQPAVMPKQEKSMIKSSETVATVPSQPVSKTNAGEPVLQVGTLPKMPLQPIPNKQQTVNPSVNEAISENGGKKISMMYLLQHYNKENAEAYKAQKMAKKNVGKAPTPDKTKPQKKQHQANVGFAVPTQSNNLGFAIPGQAATPQPTPPAAQAQKSAPQIQQQPIATPTLKPTQQASFVPRQIPQGQPANFGETTVLGSGAIGETTVLTAAQNPNKMIAPYLMRKKNNEKISLNKPVFRVGKERSYVDYFIGDNTAISRSHANFITRDGKYFVVDTNSTNHTFVNGAMIQSNVETEITNGDTIRLANEDFELKLF